MMLKCQLIYYYITFTLQINLDLSIQQQNTEKKKKPVELNRNVCFTGIEITFTFGASLVCFTFFYIWFNFVSFIQIIECVFGTIIIEWIELRALLLVRSVE